MIKLLTIGAFTLFLASCSSYDTPGETAGTLIGAGGGALIGSRFGRGGGRVAGAALGAAGGALAGRAIGRSMER